MMVIHQITKDEILANKIITKIEQALIVYKTRAKKIDINIKIGR